jgi:hypothetical protein
MSLAVGNEMSEVGVKDFNGAGFATGRWEHFPASAILHHGKSCCRLAREWIFSTDYTQLNGEHPLSGPRWIRQKFKWGPSKWPLSWCEAVELKTLDCGALAAMSSEVFTARGVRSYTAQLVQRYNKDSARHWQKKWEGDEIPSHWISEELIYHEGCAVVARDNQIKLWDPSAGWWVNARQSGGYGGVLALRVFAPQTDSPADFNWGAHRIVPNQWQEIEPLAAAPTPQS